MPYKDKEKRSAKAKEYYLEYKKNPEFKKRRSVNTKRWQAKNRERVRKWKREWGKKNPDKIFAQRLKKDYGISVETYNTLLEVQNKLCAICNKFPIHKYRRLYIDHNHITGKIRGLLCFKCNTALGLLNEDLEIINNLILYIKKHDKTDTF